MFEVGQGRGVDAYYEKYNVYNPDRDVLLDEEDLAPPKERVYWASVRAMGTSHCEMSVIRPFVREPFKQDFDAPKQIKSRTEEEQKQRDEENLKRAVRKARQEVRFRVKAGGFDRLLTTTIREYCDSREQYQKYHQAFVRLVRNRYPDWQFVCVLEYQERGALHMHYAVKGRQNIKWLLRCWLVVLGQEEYDLNRWYVHGEKLGDKSKGAVNVTSPRHQFRGHSSDWHCDKLAGYMTKYIVKDMDMVPKGAKRYWQSREIPKVDVYKFWLGASSFDAALREARDYIEEQGINSMRFWADYDIGNIWISASRPPSLRNDAPAVKIKFPCPF